MKRIVFAVTNDLNYDQRMIRICHSLSAAGYYITLVGRKVTNSKPTAEKNFRQIRLHCFFAHGIFFYAEYNIRLLFFLLFHNSDIIVAIDLDTILPCYVVSKLKRKKRVYDAHELFCEMKEIVTRPAIYKCWKWIEKNTVPKFSLGYTVNQPIADEFNKMYGVHYDVIRNAPLYDPQPIPEKKEKYIIYQGAVNEGRSFETLIPAMQYVNARLIICGDGNFMQQAIALAQKYNVADKIEFTGKLLPEQLKVVTRKSWVGVTLFDAKGKSNYYSLANRFFDYIQAGIPQVCVNYPVYSELNNKYDIAVEINDLSPETIAKNVNELLVNDELYQKLQTNCLDARKHLCWEEEEKKLLNFYHINF